MAGREYPRESAPKGRAGFWNRYLRGLQSSARNNASAYGYSVTITAAFDILTAMEGSSSVAEIFLYALGAIAAFAAVETTAIRGFTHHLEDEPSEVRALGGSISVLSVGSGLGLAFAAASLTGGAVAWPLAAFLATTVYLLGFALEMGVAERLRPTRNTDQADRS